MKQGELDSKKIIRRTERASKGEFRREEIQKENRGEYRERELPFGGSSNQYE